MHEKLIALQHQIVINLVHKIRPDLSRKQRFEQSNAEADSRSEPVRRDQQDHDPASLIEKPPAEKPDPRNLIPKLCARQEANETSQESDQKDVDDSLKQRRQQHHSQKSQASGRQFLEQQLQFIPGLALEGHERGCRRLCPDSRALFLQSFIKDRGPV